MQVRIIFVLLAFPLSVVASSSCLSFNSSELCEENDGCSWYEYDDDALCEETAWVSHLSKVFYSSIMFSCGPFMCFYGRRLFKYTMFVVGFTLVGCMTVDFYDSFDNTLTDWEIMFISFVLGILVGKALLVLTNTSVIFFGIISGIICAQGIWLGIEPSFGEDGDENMESVHFVFYVSFGLFGAMLSFKLWEKTLKFFSSFVGAFFIVSGGVFFWGELSSVDVWFSPERFLWDPDPSDLECMTFCKFCYAAWLLTFMCGVWFQHRGPALCKKDRNMSEEQKNRRALASQKVRKTSRKPPQAIINGRPVNLKFTVRRRSNVKMYL